MAALPLFPLGGVLLPGARMPLQLFEPRYLELAQHLASLPDDQRSFGVVRIRQGHEVGDGAATDLQEIGCEAKVDAMALARGDVGTVVHLVARGARRFRLDGLDEGAGTTYLTGSVTWLEDTGADDDPEVVALAARVLAAHGRYLETLGATADPVEARPKDVAFRVAERMVLDPADRQRVLDGSDAATRLRTVLSLLGRETAIVDRFAALPTPTDLGGASLN
ncbi:LON peptidase substrate-binding domain-containing protein [Phycicoccus sonneratiae]|uniref:LON peptidase substrate-binding domain-containing protein n=1 Tax=Phycicoccus sonneratiae TaxID=2807628 RepID=A0ABS2CMR8_9MICO|nr:LON peptidase substrate-binding domain-containing protein [Phycicoccus sonneraticus]MBM6401180.1 LON peptidase substrate-binding domain-containing protein [Phycicoccus sonneraticus]